MEKAKLKQQIETYLKRAVRESHSDTFKQFNNPEFNSISDNLSKIIIDIRSNFKNGSTAKWPPDGFRVGDKIKLIKLGKDGEPQIKESQISTSAQKFIKNYLRFLDDKSLVEEKVTTQDEAGYQEKKRIKEIESELENVSTFKQVKDVIKTIFLELEKNDESTRETFDNFNRLLQVAQTKLFSLARTQKELVELASGEAFSFADDRKVDDNVVNEYVSTTLFSYISNINYTNSSEKRIGLKFYIERLIDTVENPDDLSRGSTIYNLLERIASTLFSTYPGTKYNNVILDQIFSDIKYVMTDYRRHQGKSENSLTTFIYDTFKNKFIEKFGKNFFVEFVLVPKINYLIEKSYGEFIAEVSLQYLDEIFSIVGAENFYERNRRFVCKLTRELLKTSVQERTIDDVYARITKFLGSNSLKTLDRFFREIREYTDSEARDTSYHLRIAYCLIMIKATQLNEKDLSTTSDFIIKNLPEINKKREMYSDGKQEGTVTYQHDVVIHEFNKKADLYS
jgi:hypothetical protein